MLAQSEEKKMLIESMKKLTSHVSGNLARQKEIFDALSVQDFNKIIANLRDDNEYLRRISALLLCELFYRNPQTKAGLVSLLTIVPGWGRVCLGGIPESIYKYPSTLKKCVELMRGEAGEEEDKICWIINLERKSLKVELLQYKKYSSFTFIDPSKNIFGVTIRNPLAPPTASLELPLRQENISQTIPARFAESSEKPQRNSVDHFKNFVEGRSKQSYVPTKEAYMGTKSPLSMTMNLHDVRRTSINSVSSTQYRNQLNHPKRTELNTSLEMKGPDSAKSKYDYNRSYRVPYQASPKVPVGSGNDSVFLNGYSGSYQQELPTTDRSNSSRFNGLIPNTTRDAGFGEHERFYRRVKDILRK